MEPIETASFKPVFENGDKANILYIKANETDDIVSALEQSNKLSLSILQLLNRMHFLSLEAVQNGQVPDINKSENLYVLCNHGYLSELASLYLEVAGFENVYNVTGGLEAFLKLEL